jgi:hypothetical protein
MAAYFLVIHLIQVLPKYRRNVPLLTDSNLHEFVNGLDRCEGRSMETDELHRLVSQEFGERSKSSTLTEGSILKPLRSTYMPPLPQLLFAAPHVNRQSGRLFWEEHQPTPIYMLGALRFWTDVPARFTPLKLRLPSTMLSSVITIVEAAQRQSSYQSKSVPLG